MIITTLIYFLLKNVLATVTHFSLILANQETPGYLEREREYLARWVSNFLEIAAGRVLNIEISKEQCVYYINIMIMCTECRS